MIFKYSELENGTKTALENIIESEFGHIPIVRETQWATPDWTIIYYHDGEIASFYNLIERSILIDDVKVNIAGINNVITPKSFRGKGYASKMQRDAKELIFDVLKSELGVLLCADDLVPFYETLDWYRVQCPVYFEQPEGLKLWGANTMLLANGLKIHPKCINLNGLPW